MVKIAVIVKTNMSFQVFLIIIPSPFCLYVCFELALYFPWRSRASMKLL